MPHDRNYPIAIIGKGKINACSDRCIKSIMRNKLILNTLRKDKFDMFEKLRWRNFFLLRPPFKLLQILSLSFYSSLPFSKETAAVDIN